MQTRTTQIRVTLPVQLQGYLQTKADKYGLGLSAYIKNLIIDDVKDVTYPVYQMSDQAVSDLDEAKNAQVDGSLIKTKDVSSFLKNL